MSSVPPRLSRHAMDRAEFVAVGIAEVGQIDRAGAALSNAWRVLDRLAAIRNSGLVPRVRLFLACHREADRAAVGVRGRLAIDGLANHEPAAVMRVNQPALGVLRSRLPADRHEQRIVEFLRAVDVVAADHHMAEHSIPSFCVPPTEHALPAVAASPLTGAKPNQQLYP